jgi:hypothetical protein
MGMMFMNAFRLRLLIAILFGISAIAGILCGIAVGDNMRLAKELARPLPTITQTVIKTSAPKVIVKTKTITNTVYRNGYQHIGDDPLWGCAGNWYNAYIRLADNPNSPAGDPSLWNYYCPGIPMPAN